MAALKVLVVEDERDGRETVAEILSSSGHEVAAAADGLDALQRVDEGFVPDVVLVDLLMPRMDGATFLRKLRERVAGSRVRTVVVTGLHSREVKRLVEADAVLFKPYGVDELLRAVEPGRDRR